MLYELKGTKGALIFLVLFVLIFLYGAVKVNPSLCGEMVMVCAGL